MIYLMDTLTDRKVCNSLCQSKCLTIIAMLNFDGDFDGHWMVTLRVNRPLWCVHTT